VSRFPVRSITRLLRLSIDAAAEVGVARLLVRGDGEIQVNAVVSALEVYAYREGVGSIRCATVITNKPAKVAEPVTAAELPECLFAEQQVDASSLCSRVSQRRH